MQQQRTLPVAAADATAISLVLGQVRQQATVLAFGDAYHITFIAALVAIGLATLLPGRRARSAGGPEMMAAH